MQTKWKNWVHVTKLDPDKKLPPGALAEIAASGTDALMFSGTLNVTLEKMASLKKEAALAALPLVVEPGGPEVVRFEGIDLVFVPSVLNSSEVQGSSANTGTGSSTSSDFSRAISEIRSILI